MSKDIGKLLQNVKEISKIEFAQPSENINYEILAKCFEKEPIYCIKKYIYSNIRNNKYNMKKIWNIFYDNGIGLINGYFDIMQLGGYDITLFANLENYVYYMISTDQKLLEHFINYYKNFDIEYEFNLEPYLWFCILDGWTEVHLAHLELSELLEILVENNIPIQDKYWSDNVNKIKEIEEECGLSPSIFDYLPKFEITETD